MSSTKRVAPVAVYDAQQPESRPTFSDAIERLEAIHARLQDQVTSLAALGNCYLGTAIEDDAKIAKTVSPDGSVNILIDRVIGVEDLLSALEGKIDRFRGRH